MFVLLLDEKKLHIKQVLFYKSKNKSFQSHVLQFIGNSSMQFHLLLKLEENRLQ